MKIEVNRQHQPYIEGVVAKLAGKSNKTNPYNYDGTQDDYDLWDKGWHLTPRAEDLT